MKALKSKFCIVALACLAGNLPGPAAAQGEEGLTRIKLVLAIPAGERGQAGDVLGLYGLEWGRCEAGQAARLARPASGAAPGWFARGLQGLADALVAPAHANHGVHFDTPATLDLRRKVALDAAKPVQLADVAVPNGRYCELRLTFARLPPNGADPGLPHSLDLPGGPNPVRAGYAFSGIAKLSQPWNANGKAATLTLTLRPNSARKSVTPDTSALQAGTRYFSALMETASVAAK